MIPSCPSSSVISNFTSIEVFFNLYDCINTHRGNRKLNHIEKILANSQVCSVKSARVGAYTTVSPSKAPFYRHGKHFRSSSATLLKLHPKFPLFIISKTPSSLMKLFGYRAKSFFSPTHPKFLVL
ncbi:hypothetical protein AMTRI_Chr03g48030 [Amborella trichopoda]